MSGDRQRYGVAHRIIKDADGELIKNVHWDILRYGHDEDYKPAREAIPTHARPGSDEKIAILAERVAMGMPLFHPEDATTLAKLNTAEPSTRFALATCRTNATRTRDLR